MSDFIIPVLRQLLQQSPVLLVYLIGIVMAIVFWRRSPSASILVILGAGLLLLSSVTLPFVFQYILYSQRDHVSTSEGLSTVFVVLGLISGFVHAVGLGFFIAAAFAGRGRRVGGELGLEKRSTDQRAAS